MSLSGIGEVATLATSIVDRLFPDKSQQEKDAAAAQIQILTLQAQAQQGQDDINKQEAASANLFVAGWRPFVGWICGIGFLVSFLGPLISYVVALCGKTGIVFPQLDTSILMTLLMGMLGLGGMRTYEKVSGINPGH
jgi:hypothetical protein